MSESNGQSTEAGDSSQGGGTNEQQSKAKGEGAKTDDGVVANRTPEEYAARLKETSAEAKRFRQENAELKRKLEDAEKTKLEEQGNFKAIAEKESKRSAELEEKLKKTTGTFALKSVSSQVATEALKLGCIDTDALIKLADLSDLEVKEDFSVEPESVKLLLEEMLKSKPFLFQKPDPKIVDGTPGGKPGPKKKLSDLTLEQKVALLSKTQAAGV